MEAEKEPAESPSQGDLGQVHSILILREMKKGTNMKILRTDKHFGIKCKVMGNANP